ncbi:hypothetical protein Leryth_015819 [Lithospermum erythrorhizon]|nr:hypothetical protein Leryth_015819 [Lithospermum erythrorhizon]
MEPIKSFSFQSSFFATILFLFFISSPTLDAVRIRDAVTSSLINATADQVWPYIEDYCNVYQYSPLDVSFCTTGVPNKPGLIRFFTLMGPPPTGGNSTIVLWEKQQLVSINPKKRTLEFTLLANNRRISHYHPTMQVFRKGTYSQIYWTYTVELGEIYTRETFHAIIEIAASGMVERIQNLIASST